MLAIIVGSVLMAGAPATTTAPDLTRIEFEAWFHEAEANRLAIPKPVVRRAQTFRYVFVGGYRNEAIRGYFTQNIANLVRHGVSREHIHVIHPRSTKSDEENARDVAAQFAKIAGTGPERLVVIAHSRGACDALRFALANPEFIAGHVEALFLVQGPFGGSGAAAYAVGVGTPMDRKMPWRPRIIAHLAGKVFRWLASEEEREVLAGLAPEDAQARWQIMLEMHPEAVTSVGPRVFFICSKTHPRRLRFVRKAIAWYVQTYHGPGDGMVTLRDQSLSGLGTVVATVRAGHGDLTQRFPAARRSRQLRRALIDGIVMAVGRVPGAR
jgi:pimeloyl-ACP methyl ester carboxylesterase